MSLSCPRSIAAASLLSLASSLSAATPMPSGAPAAEIREAGRVSAAAAAPEVASLTTTITPPAALDDLNHGTFRFRVTNTSSVEARHVTLITWVGEQATLALATSPGWSCTPSGFGRTECTTMSIAAGESRELIVEAVYPARYLRVETAARTFFDVPIAAIHPDELTLLSLPFYRDYQVRSTEDSGSGSLRDVLAIANAECTRDAVPCRVAFNLPQPAPAGGAYTIRLLTPLPRIEVDDIAVDGETQTAFGGDTNPAGPEVVLDGAHLAAGNGLELNSTYVNVQGLAIGAFPENGVVTLARGDFAHRITIRRNYLGLDATGQAAVPNRLRGLMAYGPIGEISDNVISGNGRSGVWLQNARRLTVRHNRIGLAAASSAAIPNGASGLFFLGGASYLSENLIVDNVIAFNHDFAIGFEKSSANFTIIDANTITGNAQGGIDVGLDGPTLATAPTVTSARYDTATRTTTVEGTGLAATGLYRSTVLIYANGEVESSGASEGQIYLGRTATDATGHFHLTVPGDARGLWIDAMQMAVTDFGDLVVTTP
ncbi:MAG: parallel beta-helix repeat protein, partial [Acidobacteria bacterium]|nr:parallel beta-helix repeat protein [Acidobacteriota bacterium]